MKIVQVTTKGAVDIRSISPRNYIETYAEFLSEGIVLPTSEQLNLDFDSNYWVLLSPVEINVQIKDMSWIGFKFKRGFVFDLASVPGIFRGVVDDNAQGILYGCMAHDASYTSHCISFRDANDVLYGVSLACGYNKIRAFLAYLAVSTPIGHYLYNQKTIKRAEWQLHSFEFVKSV